MTPEFEFIVTEQSAFSVLGRIHNAGANVQQADLSAIEYQIFPTDSTTAHTPATSLTVASVIFDALQVNDGRWGKDSIGYNFRHDIADTVFTDPTKEYDLEYKFTPASGDPFRLKRIRLSLEPLKSV